MTKRARTKWLFFIGEPPNQIRSGRGYARAGDAANAAASYLEACTEFGHFPSVRLGRETLEYRYHETEDYLRDLANRVEGPEVEGPERLIISKETTE